MKNRQGLVTPPEQPLSGSLKIEIASGLLPPNKFFGIRLP